MTLNDAYCSFITVFSVLLLDIEEIRPICKKRNVRETLPVSPTTFKKLVI